MKIIFWFAVGALISESLLAGYIIGKNDLDVKARALAVRKGDELIAHIKAVPAADRRALA